MQENMELRIRLLATSSNSKKTPETGIFLNRSTTDFELQPREAGYLRYVANRPFFVVNRLYSELTPAQNARSVKRISA